MKKQNEIAGFNKLLSVDMFQENYEMKRQKYYCWQISLPEKLVIYETNVYSDLSANCYHNPMRRHCDFIV
jgi:hypothetical protein